MLLVDIGINHYFAQTCTADINKILSTTLTSQMLAVGKVLPTRGAVDVRDSVVAFR
jgi:hypothetical protein